MMDIVGMKRQMNCLKKGDMASGHRKIDGGIVPGLRLPLQVSGGCLKRVYLGTSSVVV